MLIGIQLGMDGINSIYYDTIKVRRFFASFRPIPLQALYTFQHHSRWLPIVTVLLVGSQAATYSTRPPSRSNPVTYTPASSGKRERGIPIRQTTREWGSVSPSGS